MYTAFVWWKNGDTEEIDVYGENKTDAHSRVEIILNCDYEIDWEIVEIREQPPGFLGEL